MDLFEISKLILNASDGGLDIILELFPHASTKKAFKIRQEKTPSCNLKKLKDGNWVVTDFGDDSKPKNAVLLFAEENGYEWSEAVLILAKRYGIPTGSDIPVAEPVIKTYQIHDYDKELVNGFNIETSNEFTEAELKVLGPFVTAETCALCNCFKVISYAFKKKYDDGSEKIVEISPAEQFPIFAFVNKNENENFYKIYQPKAQDKKHRFRYFGGRPSNFVNGLERLKKAYARNEDKFNQERNDDSIPEKEKKKEPEKIDQVLICSGERDALNACSLGYYVLWHNSESADWDGQMMKNIFRMVDTVINVPDLDATGILQGKNLAMKYLSIKTLWLPNWLKERKDWRGKHRKDLTDFFMLKRNMGKTWFVKHFKDLIEAAYPLQFWDERYTDTGVKYDISNTKLYNFLQQNGFYRYKVSGAKSGFIFIYISGHIVKEIEIADVYEFLKKFMEERRLPIGLKDTLINTTKVSEQKLTWIDLIDLNFDNFTATTQIFSFSHENWVISKKGIEVESNSKSFVWEDDVLDAKLIKKGYKKGIKLESDYFKIVKEKSGYNIEILEKNCEFLNFIINTSRVHWKTEFIDSWLENSHDWEEAYAIPENEIYRKQNKFNIAGDRLSEEQKEEQIGHLVNKIYALGYMLHRYKNAAKPWALVTLENGVEDEEESNGGTGKSIYTKALGEIHQIKHVDARKRDLFTNQFLYDGVTKHTGIILFDDADRYFDFGNIYSPITGPLNVNPKFGTPFEIPFSESPKFALSTNYSPRNQGTSTTRRTIYAAFSNFYHGESDELPGNTPEDTFGHQLFQDWSVEQWNKFYNFMAQCTKFYLSTEEKINPPMDGVIERTLISEIGAVFMDWADEFFMHQRPDQDGFIKFEKTLTIENLKRDKPAISKITSNKFVKKIKAYCKLNGYNYMPGIDRKQAPSVIDATKLVDWIWILKKTPSNENEFNYNDELPY